MIIVYPYKPASKSAKMLAAALGGKRIYYGLKRPINLTTDFVINWGNTTRKGWFSTCLFMLNLPGMVWLASNKLEAFKKLKEHEVPHPEFTTDATVAKGWWDNGDTVIVRAVLNGHSGRGIVVYKKGTESDQYHMGLGFPISAPLFVRYIPKKHEYRVHVFKGEVIDVQQKRKRTAIEANYQIRSHANGWVFCREGIVEPAPLRDVAVAAVGALGLDFGAVDIIHNTKHNKLYVLEVNTAPGLEGATIQNYAGAIKKCLN